MQPRKRNKLIYGIGINDADYSVNKYENVNGKQISTWRCPFYVKWKDMLARCYSSIIQTKHPTYIGCTVTESWLRFSTFKAWMETQDWEEKHLDKDLLVEGNKIYGPNTCVFVEAKVNAFINESGATRGQWPIGVYQAKDNRKYTAQSKSVVDGKRKYLGRYGTPEEAHKVWLEFKVQQAQILAAEQKDERVAKALVTRYENYII